MKVPLPEKRRTNGILETTMEQRTGANWFSGHMGGLG
jgi:hypothetical protein